MDVELIEQLRAVNDADWSGFGDLCEDAANAGVADNDRIAALEAKLAFAYDTGIETGMMGRTEEIKALLPEFAAKLVEDGFLVGCCNISMSEADDLTDELATAIEERFPHAK